MTILLVMVVAQRGIGFLRNLWFCRLLTPEELGLWNLAFSLTGLGAPLFVLGLPGSFGRYVEHYRQRGQLAVYLRRTLMATHALGIAGICVLLSGGTTSAWLALGDANQYPLLVVVAICLLSVIGFNALTELCTALRQVRWVAGIQFVNSLVFAIVGSVLLQCTDGGARAVVVAYGVACLVTSVMAFVALSRAGCWNAPKSTALTNAELWKRVAPFAFGIWTSNLATNVFSSSDRFMLVHFANASHESTIAMVGQYHSSRVLGELLISVAMLVSSILVPYLSRDWERGRQRIVGWWINFALKVACLTLFGVATAVLTVAPWLFQYVLQGKYADGLSVLPCTLAYCILFGLTVITETYLLCAERSQRIPLGFLVGIIANVCLGYVLLPRFGLTGAVWATLLANALTLITLLVLSHRNGFRLTRGTVVFLCFPLLLPIGTTVCLLSLVALLVSKNLQRQLFTPKEKRVIQDCWQSFVERLRRSSVHSYGLTTPAIPPSH